MIYIYDIYIYICMIYIYDHICICIYNYIYMYINISSSLGNYLLWPPSIYGAFCPSSSWWSQALPVPSLPSTAARCCSRCQPQCTAQFWRRNGWLRWKSWFIHVSSVDACCYLLLMVLKWKKNMSKLAMFSTYSLKKKHQELQLNPMKWWCLHLVPLHASTLQDSSEPGHVFCKTL